MSYNINQIIYNLKLSCGTLRKKWVLMKNYHMKIEKSGLDIICTIVRSVKKCLETNEWNDKNEN